MLSAYRRYFQILQAGSVILFDMERVTLPFYLTNFKEFLAFLKKFYKTKKLNTFLVNYVFLIL